MCIRDRFIPAATALLFALAACTQDELAGDNRLPEGEHPVVIRATGLSVEATPLAAPSTRAAVDGDWQGDVYKRQEQCPGMVLHLYETGEHRERQGLSADRCNEAAGTRTDTYHQTDG